MPVLGVDVGSTRIHVAIAHDGQASSVPALDGLPYLPSVVAHSRGKLTVGEPARAHSAIAPDEVLWDPARHLGADRVTLAGQDFDPAVLVAALLEQASTAGQAAGGPIEAIALSHVAWASPEARRGLAAAAETAGLNLVCSEPATTLAAVARLREQGAAGVVLFVDAGASKVEATVLALEPGLVRALGRSADATIGSNWLDGELVEAVVRGFDAGHEHSLLDDRICRGLLRDQCEAARIELSTAETVDLDLSFLVQVLGLAVPPVCRLERGFVETVARALVDACRVVCCEALEHAQIRADQLREAFLVGGLAHMPVLREAVSGFVGRAVICHGDVDGMAARGAALIAAAGIGRLNLGVVDELDARGRAAGSTTPAPDSHRPSTPDHPAPEPSSTVQAEPPAGCTTTDAEVPAPSPSEALPAEGPFANATDPASLAAVALDGALPLSPHLSLPVLLLLIGRHRQLSGQLRLWRENQEVVIAIVRGGAAGSSLELEQLRRAFDWPAGHYRLTGDPPPARLLGTRKPMVGVVVHGVRSWLRGIDPERVLAVLAPMLAEAPIVRASRAALLPLLHLSPREARFVEHVLDGATPTSEILRRGGIGRETAIQLLFVLHLLRALEWRSVEPKPGETPADRLRQHAHKLEKADHFEALGVHWSASRQEIDRALRRLEQELKPGGPSSTLDTEAAAQLLARCRRAYEAIASPSARRAYLLSIHPDIDFEAIETVTEDQSQWYAWRGAADATQESSRLKNELSELSRLQHGPPKGSG